MTLFEDSQAWLDDEFRWRVAAAVVKHAGTILETRDPQAEGYREVARVVWQWTEYGEVFARFLSMNLNISAATKDEDILDGVSRCWLPVMRGMPKE